MSIFNNKIIIFLIIILSLYIIIYVISKIECKLCKINTFYIKNDKNSDKIKLIFISDFHNKKFKNGFKDLIDSIISLNPDYIVFGGDFVDFSTIHSKKNEVKYKRSMDFIEKLAKKYEEIKDNKNYNLKRIFFGFGNHELRLKSRTDNIELIGIYNSFIKHIMDCGVKLLDDTTFKLSDGITISGLNLYEGYYKNMFERNNLHKSIDKEIINKHFHNLDKNNFNIMVFHKPDYCENFIDYGYDLVLSGHTHGGLINFPLIGPIFSPDLDLFPKYNSGLYKYKNKSVIVSSGIGEHFIKIRVNNRPEICLINIE